MYNEVRRFFLFRRRRWADTLFDTLYHVIFILGFYSLLRENSDFQLSYFYYYFILTNVVSLGNEELEYEIRSGQSFGTQYALQSVHRIYLQRAVVYFVWLSLIFWIALLLDQNRHLSLLIQLKFWYRYPCWDILSRVFWADWLQLVCPFLFLHQKKVPTTNCVSEWSSVPNILEPLFTGPLFWLVFEKGVYFNM